MKKVITMFGVIALVVGMLVGCGAKSAISINDIDWAVSEKIENGARTVGFKYTNNSPYTITYMQIRMNLKPDVTKDDLACFDYADWMGDYELEDIFMDGICESAVAPGESSKDGAFRRNNIFYVKDIAEYENVEPDIMTINYIDDSGEEHTMYYDFHSHEYYEAE